MKFQRYFLSVLFLASLGWTSVATAKVLIQSGLWTVSNEQGPGSGVNIVLQNGSLGITVFTYGDNGEPLWYMASGRLDGDQRRFTAPLLTARNGQPIDDPFSPAELVTTGKTIDLTFTSSTSAELTIDETTKTIDYLRFAGLSITIPGDPDPQFIATIPDISGEWIFINKVPGSATQTRLFNFQRMLTFPAVGQEIPDSPIIYIHEDNSLSRAFFHCRVDVFDSVNLRVPSCYLRLIENERITEYSVPTENIGLERFDIGIATIPEDPLPEIFALRLDSDRN
ncbi:MAG: hypothetical protein Tsb002_26200 [Wenzhouxiangellaceae bacterium]